MGTIRDAVEATLGSLLEERDLALSPERGLFEAGVLGAGRVSPSGTAA